LLALTTLLMTGLLAVTVTDLSLTSAVGTGGPVLIALGPLLIGGIAGSMLWIAGRLQDVTRVVQARAAHRPQLVGTVEAGPGHEARSASSRVG